ncbi:hypothetical protein NOGI109294_25120 [Nocardiopsis gilva]
MNMTRARQTNLIPTTPINGRWCFRGKCGNAVKGALSAVVQAGGSRSQGCGGSGAHSAAFSTNRRESGVIGMV